MIDHVKKNVPLPQKQQQAEGFDAFGDAFSPNKGGGRSTFSSEERKLKDAEDHMGAHAHFSSESFSFEESLKRAKKDQGEGSSEQKEEEQEQKENRLLATSDLFAGGLVSPSFDVPKTTTPDLSPDASAYREAFIQQLGDRIEQAVRVEIGLSAGNVLNFKLNFTQASEGLVGVSICVTPMGLDVVLERTTTDLSPQLLAAAQELSQTLQNRFSKRVVRVLDRCVDAPKGEGASFAASVFWDHRHKEDQEE